jgi:hypothetical protein
MRNFAGCRRACVNIFEVLCKNDVGKDMFAQQYAFLKRKEAFNQSL